MHFFNYDEKFLAKILFIFSVLTEKQMSRSIFRKESTKEIPKIKETNPWYFRRSNSKGLKRVIQIIGTFEKYSFLRIEDRHY